MTPKRVVNRLLVKLQYKLGMVRVIGHPSVLIVDTINVCNMNCPLCPTGLHVPGRAKGTMEMSMFRQIMDELGEYAFTVVLHNWGEPLLNKNIYAMIECARRKHLKTVMSSNLNIASDDDFAALVNSGLDELIVSLPGTTEETYNQYVRAGDFKQVIRNVERLVATKRSLNVAKPKIIWQFLVFAHNVHQVEELDAMAQRLGVDEVSVLSAQLGGPGQTPYVGHANTEKLAAKWLLPDKRFVREFDYFSASGNLNEHKCGFLWNALTINWDGSVSPCCCVYDPETDFGNLKQNSFAEIWNNELFRSSRALFNRKKQKVGSNNTICRACKIFSKPGTKRAEGKHVRSKQQETIL